MTLERLRTRLVAGDPWEWYWAAYRWLRRRRTRRAPRSLEPWRRVPVVDLVPGRGGFPLPAPYVRAILALVVVVLAVFVALQITSRSSAREEAARLQLEVEPAQARLAEAEAAIAALHDQIFQLQQEPAPAEPTAKALSWSGPLSGLFGIEVEGVTLWAIGNDSENGPGMVVAGVAVDLRAMADFQTELRNEGALFDLESIQWETGDDSLIFSAVLRLVDQG